LTQLGKNSSLFHQKQKIDSLTDKHFGTKMIKGKYNIEKKQRHTSAEM